MSSSRPMPSEYAAATESVASCSLNPSMMSAPTAQSKGKYLYYERYYYGAFALNNRKAGIIVNAAA